MPFGMGMKPMNTVASQARQRSSLSTTDTLLIPCVVVMIIGDHDIVLLNKYAPNKGTVRLGSTIDIIGLSLGNCHLSATNHSLATERKPFGPGQRRFRAELMLQTSLCANTMWPRTYPQDKSKLLISRRYTPPLWATAMGVACVIQPNLFLFSRVTSRKRTLPMRNHQRYFQCCHRC